jgi:hypothetical protein
MDELIKAIVTIAALVGLSVLSSWMKKRSETEQAEEWPEEKNASPTRTPPVRQRSTLAPPPSQPRPAKALNWEEELRRLLEGDTAPPPPPPPIVIQEIRPEPVQEIAPVVPAPMHRAIAAETEEEGPQGILASLTDSRKAYERALRIQDETSRHLKHAAASARVAPVVMQRTTLAPDIQDMVRNLHAPSQARRAFIASLIFNPPKALEH